MDPQQITIEKVKTIVGDLYLQVAMLSEQVETLTQKLAAGEPKDTATPKQEEV